MHKQTSSSVEETQAVGLHPAKVEFQLFALLLVALCLTPTASASRADAIGGTTKMTSSIAYAIEQPTGTDNAEKLNIKLLQDEALRLWAVDEYSAIELGHALIALKEAMKHGEFIKWYQQAGMKKWRVDYCIREAKGKRRSGSKKEAPAFQLNHLNLNLGNGASVNEGKHGCTSIHVGKNGTTSFDGVLVQRISLPPGSPVSEIEGLIPAEELPRNPATGDTFAVSFGKIETTLRKSLPSRKTCTAPGKRDTTTTFATENIDNFPSEVERWFSEAAEAAETDSPAPVDGSYLQKLLSAARDFDPDAAIILKFKRGNYLVCELESHEQTWVGIIRTLEPLAV